MSAVQPINPPALDVAALDLSALGSAQDAYHQLMDTLYVVAEAVTQRAGESLPGLAESFPDEVLLVVGGKARGPLGFFAGDKWRLEGHRFHEININIGHGAYAGANSADYAEDVLVTIVHELVHFYARTQDIRDVTGRGRYHNRKFAELAHALGLRVEPSGRSHIGFITTALNSARRLLYSDLLQQVENALRLTSAPLPAPPTAPSTAMTPLAIALHASKAAPLGKYVFAHCACHDKRGNPRTVRMARGWWQPGTVGCGICLQLFVESPPSSADRAAKPSRPATAR